MSGAAPSWLAEELVPGMRTALAAGQRPVIEGARPAAVLILLCRPATPPRLPSPGRLAEAGVLLVRKSTDLRSHAGQVAFPGGRREDADADATATALREAAEETGIVPGDVQVLAELPPIGLPPSNHTVTPVVAWWHTPGPVRVDGTEVVDAVVLPLTELASPAHVVAVRHVGSPGTWPGYDVPGWFVWGFTAWLLTVMLRACGAEVRWDTSRTVDVPVTVR